MFELDTRVRLPVLGQFKVRRALRVLGIALCLAGLLIGVGWDFVLSGAGYLLALLLGAIVGMNSSRIRNRELYGDLLFAIGIAGVLGWVGFGMVPTLALPEIQLHEGIVFIYTRFGGAYVMITATFCIGLFGGLILESYDYRVPPRKAGLTLAFGLVLVAASYVLMADLGGIGTPSATTVLGWELFRTTVLFAGATVAFAGVAGLARTVPLGHALLAMAVITTSFAGAGVAHAYDEFTVSVGVNEIEEQATGSVEDAEVVGDELHVEITVENPTDRTFTVNDVGSLRVYDGYELVAMSTLSSTHDPGPQELAPGETVTIEYTMPLGPDEVESVEAVIEDGDVRYGVSVPGTYEHRDITVTF